MDIPEQIIIPRGRRRVDNAAVTDSSNRLTVDLNQARMPEAWRKHRFYIKPKEKRKQRERERTQEKESGRIEERERESKALCTHACLNGPDRVHECVCVSLSIPLLCFMQYCLRSQAVRGKM